MNKELARLLGLPKETVKDFDKEMKPIVYILNSKGYKTTDCCQGHVTSGVSFNSRVGLYISFQKDYDFPIEPPFVKRVGNKKYGGLRRKRPHGRIRTCIYYFTSRKTSNDRKEQERKDFVESIKEWAESLPEYKEEN